MVGTGYWRGGWWALGLGLLLAGAVQAQDEVIEQWAHGVVGFSSAKTENGFGRFDIDGQPDGSCQLALDRPYTRFSWTPAHADSGDVWIEVRFAQPVLATGIEIYQTLNPGALTRVQVRSLEGELVEIWSGTDPNRTCPAVFSLPIEALDFPVVNVRLELNTALVPGYNQIDAVKLTGITTEFKFLFGLQPLSVIDGLENFVASSLGDLDNDGHMDLIGLPTLFKVDELLHNQGDGAFFDRSSVLPLPDSMFVNGGPLAADYDNDGDLDIFYPMSDVVTPTLLPSLLLRNDRGRFTDVSREAGFTELQMHVAAIWLDYNNDGFLDLYAGNWTFKPVPVDLQNILYRNNGDGTFADVTQEAGLDLDWHQPPSELVGGTVHGYVGADLDDNGWTDLYVAVPGSPDRLLLNEQGRFRDAASPDLNILGQNFLVAAGDIDHDLDLDLYVPTSSLAVNVEQVDEVLPERSRFLLNLGNGRFVDFATGLGLESLTLTNAAGGRLFDYDNDGDLDLFPGASVPFFENSGDGLFSKRPFQSGLIGISVVGDYDGDGFLDVLGDNSLYRNRGNENHYSRVDLVGTTSNRDGLGARVVARTDDNQQLGVLLGGNGWHQNEPVVHFGLGEHTVVDELEITWPSGQVDVLNAIPADQVIRVIEGQGEWHPAEKTVWTVAPPTSVDFGQTVDFVAVARPALFESGATVTSAVADLRGLGGPEAVPLTDQGDGTYRLEAHFTVGGDQPLREVSILFLQDTSLGEHWINLSRAVEVEGDPLTAVLETRDGTTPEDFGLAQNYPNPFNAGTVIPFSLPTTGPVELVVFNLAGQKVVTLAEGVRQAGSYRLQWDGRDESGRELASGLYLYRLQAGHRVETRKLLLLR
ncbi:MAG: T9SS type A sorting domain-containing protein [Candidatus Latescibacteria bacterium]|nr:T9SS type A sorting domain-containing protein [Candidatus Latescibacterota bacterium]